MSVSGFCSRKTSFNEDLSQFNKLKFFILFVNRETIGSDKRWFEETEGEGLEADFEWLGGTMQGIFHPILVFFFGMFLKARKKIHLIVVVEKVLVK